MRRPHPIVAPVAGVFRPECGAPAGLQIEHSTLPASTEARSTVAPVDRAAPARGGASPPPEPQPNVSTALRAHARYVVCSPFHDGAGRCVVRPALRVHHAHVEASRAYARAR